MTETCTVISVFEGGNRKAIRGDSAGVFVPNIRAKIMSPDGKALGPGEVGELWSWSPSNALGCGCSLDALVLSSCTVIKTSATRKRRPKRSRMAGCGQATRVSCETIGYILSIELRSELYRSSVRLHAFIDARGIRRLIKVKGNQVAVRFLGSLPYQHG